MSKNLPIELKAPETNAVNARHYNDLIAVRLAAECTLNYLALRKIDGPEIQSLKTALELSRKR